MQAVPIKMFALQMTEERATIQFHVYFHQSGIARTQKQARN